jgi:hypothetical protein
VNPAQTVLLPNENILPTTGISAESSEEIFPCRTEFVTKLGPQISLLPVPIFGVNKLHENDLKFHPDAPLIKANKLTVEDLVKQNFDLEDPGRLDRPLQAVRPPLPEKQPVGQTPTSSRSISRITPRIAAKLWK